MKMLAVDYGESRTGLAECDAGETLVTPVLPQIEEKSIKKVAALILERAAALGAKQLVLGLPLNMDGTEGKRAAKSRKLAAILQEMNGSCPVVLWDERRTTVSAAAILAENDIFGQKRKERLDSVSAAVTLESYLAWRKNHPEEK